MVIALIITVEDLVTLVVAALLVTLKVVHMHLTTHRMLPLVAVALVSTIDHIKEQ